MCGSLAYNARAQLHQRVFEEDIASVVAEPEKKPVEIKEKTRQEKEAEIVPKFKGAVNVRLRMHSACAHTEPGRHRCPAVVVQHHDPASLRHR